MSSYYFSIIMPAYNCEKTICKAILSVISQTYTNWELIIVDDGSTDKTSELILDYSKKDCRIKYLRFEKNKGPYLARKNGIIVAKGDYVCFLDADDCYDNALLYSCFEVLQSNENYEILYFGTVFWVNEERLCYDVPFSNQFVNRSRFASFCFNVGQLYTGLWNKVFKRSLLLNSFKDDALFLEYRYAEDTYVVMNALLESNGVFVIGMHLYNYFRNCSGSITSGIDSKDMIGELMIFNNLLSKYILDNLITDALEHFFMRYYSSLFNYVSFAKKEKKCKKQIKKELNLIYCELINDLYIKKRKELIKKRIVSRKKDFKIRLFIKKWFVLL